METSFKNWRDRDYAVTALVSTYRSSAFMAECLSDLEGQSAAGEMEIVVVDAASPEAEGEVVRDFQARYDNIRYYRTPERIGVYAAWNLAVREARGEFLTTQNTNDRLFPRAHEVMLAALRADPEAALVFGDYRATELPHQPLEGFVESELYKDAFVWDHFSYQRLLACCMVGPQPMWRRSVHEEVGFFDESLVALGDQDFWLRLGRARKIIHIRDVIGLVWLADDSLSRSERAAEEERLVRARHQGAVSVEQAERLDALVAEISILLDADRLPEALARYEAARPGLYDLEPVLELDALMAGLKQALQK